MNSPFPHWVKHPFPPVLPGWRTMVGRPGIRRTKWYVSGLWFFEPFIFAIFPTNYTPFSLFLPHYLCPPPFTTSRRGQDFISYTLETVYGQQVAVIHEQEAVPLLVYTGTLDLPPLGPLLPPIDMKTPATDN